MSNKNDIKKELKQLQERFDKIQAAEDRFQAIFDNSPDGIVIINPTNNAQGPWLIEDCNKAFCKMNGYDREELIGQDINVVTVDPEPWDQYYQKLKEGARSVEAIHRRKDGTTFPIQASTCLVTLGGQERVLGIDRDITEEKRLSQYTDDLRKDVGRTFHSFTSTLLQVQLAMKPIIKTLGPDPFKEGLSPTIDKIWGELVGSRNILASSLNNLIDSSKSDFQKEALSQEDWNKLAKLPSQLLKVEEVEIVEQRVPVLLLEARQVIDIIDRIQTGKIRRELVRQVSRNAEQLEHLTCLVLLRWARDRVVDTDYLVRDMRERVITDIQWVEEYGVYEFGDLVKEAIVGLTVYATYRGVDLKMEDNLAKDARVKVIKRDVIRAVNNLLHNAIKYSWSRSEDKPPWIDIQTYVKEDRVYVEIEDYGVPIPKDELDGELIFQFGFRGRLAGERGRIGTGIGLFDARETANRYGGNVTLNSYPASPCEPADYLKVPHLKTALLYLPIYKG